MTNSAQPAQFTQPGPGLVFGERLLVADGAMGRMLQASDISLDDFGGHEGCNEILNVTRPDVVTAVHHGYLQAGVDCITTNTFGSNPGNLGEYGLTGRIAELSEAGARLARAAASQWSAPDRPRWVPGSVGPGTQLPTLGHVRFAELRDAYQENVAGLLRGGVDADLEDRAKVVSLLAPERIGVSLTEEFQLVPGQSTDALIAFHPEARYFSA